jgi:hypothetical protein
MSKTGSILIIIAMLGLHGNVNAHSHLDGSANLSVVAQRGRHRTYKSKAHHARTRKRHQAAPRVSSGKRLRRISPSDQPANMAPQPLDIPPVKPPKKKLPPADIRNPGQ